MSTGQWVVAIILSLLFVVLTWASWRRNKQGLRVKREGKYRPYQPNDWMLLALGAICLGSQVSCQSIIDHQATKPDGSRSSTYVYTTFGGDALELERSKDRLYASGLNTSKSTLSGIRTTGTVAGLGIASDQILGLGAQHVQVENAKTAAELSKAGISATKAVDLAGIKAGTDALKITTVRQFTWTEDTQPSYYWP